jgi:hypothetical protein
MKWWYFLVLGFGIVLGLWMWGKYGVKTASKVAVVEGNDIKKALVKVTPKSNFDKLGKEEKVMEISGSVQSWNPETGILEFVYNDKVWRVKIDLSQTMMMVNSFKDKMSMISVTEISDPNWKGGFCPSDNVVMRFKDEEVFVVFNNGNRTCGFLDR